jgi:hypothetical protein
MKRAAVRDCIVFRGEQLLPPEWASLRAAGPIRTFNPGLVRDGDGWLFAYRIVGADGLRRIGMCRLDRDLQIVPGSHIPWSDHVTFRTDVDYPEVATRWFADPRLYRFGAQLFIYWNSGWHDPRNYQFLQELDPNSLRPRGLAREMVLQGERQKLEKNWTIFADAGSRLRAIYSVAPHRVLEFSFEGTGEIVFADLTRTEWTLRDYPPCHGGLRGGAPPVIFDDRHWSFCHSVHDSPHGYRYAPAVYSFSASFPFEPTHEPTKPIGLGNPFGEQRVHERLNAAVGEVIYPCGAAHDGTRWIVSHGINDEFCALSTLGHEDVVATVRVRGE